jgi:hypothetical protein
VRGYLQTLCRSLSSSFSAAAAEDELAIDRCILRSEALDLGWTLQRYVAGARLTVAYWSFVD